MIKVVLDTNILVSALLSYGPPAVITDMVAEIKLIPVHNETIIGEYWNVLQRKKFGFSPYQVNRLIGDIIRVGIATEIKVVSKFPKELFVVTPAEFLRMFYEQNEKKNIICCILNHLFIGE